MLHLIPLQKCWLYIAIVNRLFQLYWTLFPYSKSSDYLCFTYPKLVLVVMAAALHHPLGVLHVIMICKFLYCFHLITFHPSLLPLRYSLHISCKQNFLRTSHSLSLPLFIYGGCNYYHLLHYHYILFFLHTSDNRK